MAGLAVNISRTMEYPSRGTATTTGSHHGMVIPRSHRTRIITGRPATPTQSTTITILCPTITTIPTTIGTIRRYPMTNGGTPGGGTMSTAREERNPAFPAAGAITADSASEIPEKGHCLSNEDRLGEARDFGFSGHPVDCLFLKYPFLPAPPAGIMPIFPRTGSQCNLMALRSILYG